MTGDYIGPTVDDTAQGNSFRTNDDRFYFQPEALSLFLRKRLTWLRALGSLTFKSGKSKDILSRTDSGST